jgi:hypothetical protein
MNDILGFLFSPWGWLSLAGILAIMEILLPGAVMMWLGGAALATAIHTLAFNLGPGGQLFAFAGWTIVALLLSRRVKARRPITSADDKLNRRGERLVGESAVVVQAIGGGKGRVRLGDSEWLAYGPDAEAGARVRVVGTNGAILRVEPEAAPQALRPALPASDPPR